MKPPTNADLANRNLELSADMVADHPECERHLQAATVFALLAIADELREANDPHDVAGYMASLRTENT